MKIFKMFGIICVGVALFLVVPAWLFGVEDVWTFCSELAKQTSNIPKGGERVPITEKQGFIFVRGCSMDDMM